jgi:hypothetical protein
MTLHRTQKLAIGALIGILATTLLVSIASASVTLTASSTVADGELTTTLTWDSTHSSCIGSGHPAWDGPKASSGTQQLPAITMSGTYALTLTCQSEGDMRATVHWVNPTTNTDGTAYTNPAGTRIHYGRSANELVQTVQIDDPQATSHVFDALDAGEWFFAARSVNANGAASTISNTASKVLRAEVTEAESVSLTVNPVPSAIVLAVE